MLVNEYKDVKGFLAVDKLNHIYTLEKGVLRKYQENSLKASYSNRHLGLITHIDVSDPLNILVFFQDFGAIVFLDKSLTEKSVFMATDLHDYEIPHQVCFSSQGGFWAYYGNSFQLVRYNHRGMIEISGTDIQKSYPAFTAPRQMIERDDKLFLVGDGVWVFDLYANFLFHIPQITTTTIQVVSHYIFYLKNSKLHSFNLLSSEERVILLPQNNLISFFLQQELIFLQSSVSLKKFRHKGILN